MDSGDLKIFQAVAEEGSITKAANRLNYVQSNVTARIQQLEAELQTTLFYRHSRGMILTPTGKTLLEYAVKIRHLLDEAQKAVQDSPIPRGTLSIGALETTAAVRLPVILSAFHRQYPEVELSLVTGPTELLVGEVLQYKLDGAFVSGPIEHPDLQQTTIFDEELVLVSEAEENEFETAKRKNLLIFPKGCSYRAKLEQWLMADGILPLKKMEFSTLEAILGGVAAGLGVSLLPKSLINKLEMDGAVRSFPIPAVFGKVKTVFVHRQDLLVTVAFQKFVELIREKNALHSHQELFRVRQGRE